MVYSNSFSSFTSFQEQCMQKLIAFAKRSPVLLSINTSPVAVVVTLVNSGVEYFFKWEDYSDITDPKDFVAAVKKVLVKGHYPRLVRNEVVNTTISSKEIADLLLKGTSLEDVEKMMNNTLTKEVVYRIESVMLWNNKFILKKEDDPNFSYVYKYNKAGSIFLTQYRTQAFADLIEAGLEFFDNATLIKVCESPTNQKG